MTQYTDTGRWRDAASPLSALTLEIAEGVATLRLNRPRHANAIDPDMASDLLEAATRIAETPGVRAVLIALLLASNTLPFAERLNAAIVAGALTLDDDIEAADLGGSPRVALSALTQAIAHAHAFPGEVLVLAADRRKARPGSAQELEYGDGAAAALIGRDNVLAEFLGSATLSVDFVDHFRAAGEETDYHWEERWVRDEGVSKLMPRVVAGAVRDVLDGEFDAEGRAPCQIDGGLKCFGHPVGASGIRMLYEIYLQLNGRAGARQLGDPRLGLIHNLGGQPSQNVCAVSIVGREGV